MANWGIKVSKQGYSVYSPDHKQRLHSKYPFMKVAMQGMSTMTKSSGQSSVSVTIDHNLGYIPIVYVYGQYIQEDGSTVQRYLRYPFRDTFGLHLWETYNISVSTTQLTISYTIGSSDYLNMSITLGYFYYICYDQAN